MSIKLSHTGARPVNPCIVPGYVVSGEWSARVTAAIVAGALAAAGKGARK